MVVAVLEPAISVVMWRRSKPTELHDHKMYLQKTKSDTAEIYKAMKMHTYLTGMYYSDLILLIVCQLAPSSDFVAKGELYLE